MTNNPFKLRSGNGVPFKRMGSSPVKQSIDPLDLGLIDEAKKVKVKKPVSKPYKFSTKKKALSRFVPYVGWGLLASDIVGTVKKMKSGHTFKQAVKSQVLGTD